MSDPRITDEATEAAAHSLRQFDAEGQWEPGELGLLLAYRDAARGALEAAVPLLTPQPVVDREAVVQALLAVWMQRSASMVAASPEDHCRILADAVLALLDGSTK